jgi:serine/threonine protein kinase
LAAAGISKAHTDVTATFTLGTIGTPAWASPEQLNGKHEGEPSDVWSFGVIVWEVMARQIPGGGCAPMEQLVGIMSGKRLPTPELRLPAPESAAEAASQAAAWAKLIALMEGCWHKRAGERVRFARAAAVLRALRDGREMEEEEEEKEKEEEGITEEEDEQEEVKEE